MNIEEIDDAISAAMNALGRAQVLLRKSASPRGGFDVLVLTDTEPRASSGDIAKQALAKLADATRRINAIKSADKRKEREAAA